MVEIIKDKYYSGNEQEGATRTRPDDDREPVNWTEDNNTYTYEIGRVTCRYGESALGIEFKHEEKEPFILTEDVGSGYAVRFRRGN